VTGPWALDRGARCIPDGETCFSVWAPRARTVTVRLGETLHALDAGPDGVHAGIVPRAPLGTDYAYRLDGGPDRPDPVSRYQPHGVHGASRIVAPNAFEWTDDDWTGLAMRDLVLYELHVGTFTPAGTFDGVITRLPELAELGITAVELMPVAAFPGTRNWGYDGVHPYAPHVAYGGPDGLRRLVSAAHRAGIGVILDVVYNHLGPEGNYLAEFGPYFTDRYHTPWGAAMNFDGPDSDEVRRYVIDNALYWITEYRLDGLRLDAVHAIYDFSAWHILEEVAAAVHRQADALGRSVLVIAESDLNDPRLVRGVQAGGYGLDGQWNDDFHHAVHARLTGEQSGYYVDFGRTADIAASLTNRFVLDGRRSAFRRRRHGAPAMDVPADRFVVAIQNHDQVGNRAKGERLGALVDPRRRRLAAALLLCAPYVPLLFMGEEYDEPHPFQYFVSHGDPDLVDAVRAGRRREFSDFAWRDEVPDPQAEATFENSKLQWALRTRPPHAQLLALYRDLLAVRKREMVLEPAGAEVIGSIDEHRDVIGVGFVSESAVRLHAWFNCSESEVHVDVERRVSSTPATLVLATDAIPYGGQGGTCLYVTSGTQRLRLAPLAAAILRFGEDD
jgi:maltooligosyltrehalose trehalohydrolase